MRSSEIRYLGMPASTSADWLARLSKSTYLEHGIDSYNQGEALHLLEQRVAEILGKPSALFFPKGMTAQFAVLKAAEERVANPYFGLHPLSHIAWDEAEAYEHLLQLQGVAIGADHAPFTVEDLNTVQQELASLMVELPLRRAGFRCSSWTELQAIQQWSVIHGVHLHLDGARLWEAAHYYQKSEAEISTLFDSVYVSFYKGLGGIGGAILAGETSFIEHCKVWRTRLAGDMFTAFPQIISALDGLDNYRDKLSALVERAHQLAEKLSELTELEVLAPHTNGFIVYLEGNKEALNSKVDLLNKEYGLCLFRQVDYLPNSDRLMVELQIGHEHEKISDQEVLAYFKALIKS